MKETSGSNLNDAKEAVGDKSLLSRKSCTNKGPEAGTRGMDMY